jgi:hypothetical protein
MQTAVVDQLEDPRFHIFSGGLIVILCKLFASFSLFFLRGVVLCSHHHVSLGGLTVILLKWV